MATSGSTNFSVAANTLVQNAFQIAGVYGVGRSLSAEDQSLAFSLLNMLIKTWSTKGLHLWSKERAYIFPVQYQSEYSLGSGAYACLKSDAVISTVSASEAAGQTSISVTSSAGMAASDVVGVVLDSGAVHYTTISSVTDSTTIVLNSALPSVASAANLVYTYTTVLGKPLRMHSVRRIEGSGSSETSLAMELRSVSDYDDITNKNSRGVSTLASYRPANTSGKFNVWPVLSSGKYYFEATIERALEDIDTSADDFDFPQEWLEPLTYQLALRLCLPFGRSERYTQLLPIASDLYEQLLDFDHEITDVQLVPDNS